MIQRTRENKIAFTKCYKWRLIILGLGFPHEPSVSVDILPHENLKIKTQKQVIDQRSRPFLLVQGSRCRRFESILFWVTQTSGVTSTGLRVGRVPQSRRRSSSPAGTWASSWSLLDRSGRSRTSASSPASPTSSPRTKSAVDEKYLRMQTSNKNLPKRVEPRTLKPIFILVP